MPRLDPRTLRFAGLVGCVSASVCTARVEASPTPATQASSVSSKHGGSIETSAMLAATIKAIDLRTRTLTLVGLEGRATTLAVRNSQRLDGVAPGDLVEIMSVRGVAISIPRAS